MSLAAAVIMVTILGSVGPWLPGLVDAFSHDFSSSIPQSQPACLVPSTGPAKFTETCSPSGSISPNLVGADGVPNLSLPKTVVSTVDSLLGAGGLLQTSPDNWTLYNSGIQLRLLGNPAPHDELLGPSGTVVSRYLS
ncbi:hypothetical protein J2P12_05300, partial [Candidatus Bathyarchaeota archaeon]|nr:hypothetical protein [Candidatus Bathyarchaeota archaeon]